MSANANPMFTRVGAVQGGVTLTTAAADYTGQGILNYLVFQADPSNGSFVQKLRFKSLGTNVASVARIHLNMGTLNLASPLAAVSGTPTGTPNAGAGNLAVGNYFAKIQAVDQWGGGSVMSNETSTVNVTSAGSAITWDWNAVAGAVKYRIFVGPVTGGQVVMFESTSTSYQMTSALISATSATPVQGNPADYLSQNMFYGEANLPATTLSATSATAEVEYPMNLALPPGYHVLVGLGTTVAAGWVVTAVGGHY
jgi:hypothetical protein